VVLGLGVLDKGARADDLMSLALRVHFGSASNAQLVTGLYENVAGVAPCASQLSYFTGLLDSGAMSRVSLAQMAAETGLNLDHIGFVGLQHTGLAYA
jgi:hypothetical protein